VQSRPQTTLIRGLCAARRHTCTARRIHIGLWSVGPERCSQRRCDDPFQTDPPMINWRVPIVKLRGSRCFFDCRENICQRMSHPLSSQSVVRSKEVCFLVLSRAADPCLPQLSLSRLGTTNSALARNARHARQTLRHRLRTQDKV
jgi:hypothetical protein